MLFSVALEARFHIKFRIERIEVFAVQAVLYLFQSFTEPLEMDDFPGTQKSKWIQYIRIINNADKVFVGAPGLQPGFHEGL